MALYLLPLIAAGIGINRVSQVLLEHLRVAEKNYDDQQGQARPGAPREPPRPPGT